MAVSIGGHNTIALLYMTGIMEIRKLTNLSEVVFRMHPVEYDEDKGSPLLKWEKHELYCIYEDRLEIFDIVNKKRGYFPISEHAHNEKIVDIMSSNLM